MKLANILRAIVYSAAAAFLIFNQNHSVGIGISVMQFVSTAIAFGSLVLFRIDADQPKWFSQVIPGIIAFLVALLSIFSAPNSPTAMLTFFTGLVAFFAGANGLVEFIASRGSSGIDKLELRISATIGLVTALVFAFASLDSLNAVGFFSAYLSILAVQRAIWLASLKSKD